MTYQGKEVFTSDDFDYAAAKPGDYVEEAVVDAAMNCLPPICMSSACAQMGDPYGMRQDPTTGAWRSTYATFKRCLDVSGIWEYCDEFVMRLSDGYQTVLGENGSTLSGGERQRISIARALLKDAPIILLDEATASLDPENEVLIQRAIARLVEGKTVIMIAHRLRTVVDADQIFVLENGKLVERGTHDELIAHKGLYEKLYHIQQESLDWVV